MPLRLFANSERSGAYASRVLYLGTMMGFWFFLTQYMQKVLGFTALEAGAGFLPMTLPNFFTALALPKLTARFGNGRLLVVGLVLSAIGMFALSFIITESHYWLAVALPMVLIGVGQGLTLSPLTLSGITQVKSEDAGAASGLVNVAHQVGGSIGLGVLVVVYASSQLPNADAPALLTHKISTALVAGAVMLCVAIVISYLFIFKKKTN